MRRPVRLLLGSLLLGALLAVTTDSCEKPWATGTCYLHCSCNNCDDEVSAGNNTKSECENWWNTQKNNGDCGCPCTWEWVAY
ncbi:MAG: hypothetical protein MUE74_10200 [Bacteroidales bacterium]|nr:hypothetical protein [Bacteroidales bacterium]